MKPSSLALAILATIVVSVSGLSLRVRTPGASHDENQFNFKILQGQSFEAECWPDEFEYESEMANYSIQFLKRGATYEPKPMWSDDPMSLGESIVISGNEFINPAIPEADRARYEVILKEHSEDGTTVPKYVLSVTNAQPQDTGDLECFFVEDMSDPLGDTTTGVGYVLAEEWGSSVIVLGDIEEVLMFKYTMNNKKRYPIELESTLHNGDTVTVRAGEPLPDIGCRFFYPSYYPTVSFLLKRASGEFVEDLTSSFHRYHNYNRTVVSQNGPLFNVRYMQDYIDQTSVYAGQSRFVVAPEHHGMYLWCEGQVVEDPHTLPMHSVHVRLSVEGEEGDEKKKYEEGESDDPVVHISRPVTTPSHTAPDAKLQPPKDPKSPDKPAEVPDSMEDREADPVVGGEGSSSSPVTVSPLLIICTVVFIFST